MALRVGARDDGPERSFGASAQMAAGSEGTVPRSYLRLKDRWEEHVDALMEEWKTLNIISALLLG